MPVAGATPPVTGYLIEAQPRGEEIFGAAPKLAQRRAPDRPDDLRLARLDAQALRQNGKPDQGIAAARRMC